MKQWRVQIEALIETNDEMSAEDVEQSVAVCKYETNTYDDTEAFLPKAEGWEVIEYREIVVEEEAGGAQ